MRVALVHDYLKEFGGAERVLEALHGIWPDAPIYTAFALPEKWGVHRERMEKWDIRTTWLQKWPFRDRLTSHYSILGPTAFEDLDLREYDVIINSTNPYISKAVITHPNQLHIAYIHTPPKAPWGYEGASKARKKWYWKPMVALGDHYLRMVDFVASQRPDVLVANSETVAMRIRKFYKRECEVIYPPIEIKYQKSNIKNTNQILKRTRNSKLETGNYYLMVGRLVSGKNMDVPVKVAMKSGVQLKIVGKKMGLDNVKEELREMARGHENIEFLGEVANEQLWELYRGAKAVIDPRPNEDFGIIPVESMAAGVPVVARNSGGFRETVIDGKTGVLFGDKDGDLVEGLMEAIKRFNKLKWSAAVCKKQASKFSKERFEKEMRELVEREWGKIVRK